jgi:meso-butanediol dehydrogenase / (S,S)-butanediol dehydrogenase / diacetyl reductase
MELTGSTVIVTGGSRGIGRGIALAFAAEGANLVIGDLLGSSDVAAAAADTKEAVESLGGKARTVEVDVTDPAANDALVAAALDTFGRLDVVCANAGVIVPGPLAQTTPEQWDFMFDVNAKGAFLTCRSAIPHFVAQKEGCFIVTASIAGKRGQAGAGAYAASKFAAVGLTQSLALELGPLNIRANAICPGYLGTSMWLNDILARQKDAGRDTAEVFEKFATQNTPLGRPQTPADIGQAAVYLARADNVTGIALNVAGGVEQW